MKVYNLINDKGNRAQNQIVVELGNGVFYFTSYSCPVCKIDKGEVTLHPTYWDYSRTTSKHLYIFLRSNGFCVDNKKGVERRIKSGEFKVKSFKLLTIKNYHSNN